MRYTNWLPQSMLSEIDLAVRAVESKYNLERIGYRLYKTPFGVCLQQFSRWGQWVAADTLVSSASREEQPWTKELMDHHQTDHLFILGPKATLHLPENYLLDQVHTRFNSLELLACV